jgi:transposase
LQLLWEEYRENTPDGRSYSRFRELYGEWASKLDLVLRHEHRAGEKMFVDYAGDCVRTIHASRISENFPISFWC